MHNFGKFPAAVRSNLFNIESRRYAAQFATAHFNSAIFVQKKTLSGAAPHQQKALIPSSFQCVVSTHFGNCVSLTLSLLLWFYRRISNV
jgi:hypothetical protein